MSSDQPIGIFDSGVGGLSVAIEVAQQLPRERLIYYGDSGRAPWGVRPPEEIREFSTAATRFLLEKDVKIIVFACNTGTVHAIKHLRATFPQIPFVGTVPAVKPAAAATRSGRIGVLATYATAHGQALADLIDQFVEPVGVEVTVVAPPGRLVELVEAGDVAGPETLAILHDALDPLLAAGVDTLVLGSTHFPFLRGAIEQVSGGRLQQIESGAAVARQTARVLAERDLLAPDWQHGGLKRMDAYTSGEIWQARRTFEQLLGFHLPVHYHDAMAAPVDFYPEGVC